MKKTCLKQPLQKLYPAKKLETKHKNKCLSYYIYSIATLQCKLCLMFVTTGHLHLRHVLPSQLSKLIK